MRNAHEKIFRKKSEVKSEKMQNNDRRVEMLKGIIL